MRVTNIIALTVALLFTAIALGQSQESFLDVGEHPPIAILINDSPWFGGFEAVVELYEQQTGNEVNVEVSPYGGVLEKARNAVRGAESPFDLVNLDTQWTIEFYDSGFVTPLSHIDPNFALPEQVFTYDDSYFWNAEKEWRTSDGGLLMAFPPNGNIQLLFYRGDLYREAGLEPPETWEDVFTICEQMHNPPSLNAFVVRGERGNSIRFNWMPYMLGHGASIVRDPENGDYTVTINSPEAKEALDLYIRLANECGPANSGSIGQGDMIQLISTGRALNIVAVVAAWPSFDDPERSLVVGDIEATIIPRPVDGTHASTIGNWHFAVPANLTEERQRAALAFAEWFLTFDAQYEYAKAGGVPVRRDVFSSDLAAQDEFRWMEAYVNTMPHAKQVLGFEEGAQVEEILGIRLNQAVIGDLTSAEALNLAAIEIHQIFEDNGRNTALLDPLP